MKKFSKIIVIFDLVSRFSVKKSTNGVKETRVTVLKKDCKKTKRKSIKNTFGIIGNISKNKL